MEQSSTPWRAFDAPAPTEATAATQGNSGRGAPATGGASRPLALAGIAGAIAIGGLAFVLALDSTGDGSVDGPATMAVASGSADPVAGDSEIVVDVGGAVIAPGVYRLATGARVGDAIAAAGGFGPRVDVARVGAELNLAAPLADGARIRVPSRDDAGPSAGPGGTSAAGQEGAGGAGRLLNLNTATEAELENLPGIGPVTAGKIVESRAQSPFRTVDDLRERGLIGQKTFDRIKPLLTVG